MRLLSGLVAVLALLVGASVAHAQQPGDARKGRGYAERVCAECHAVLQAQDVSPVPRATPFRVVANTPGMTGTALAVWLRTPHPTMPNLIIEERDRDDVIAYVLSLREKK